MCLHFVNCQTVEQIHANEQIKAIIIDILADIWTAQHFRQEQTADEDIEPILTAKEEGRRPGTL